jgi:hypothetical protein
MVPISIDISGAVQRLMLTQEEVKSYSRFVLDSIGTRYMQLWEQGVDRKLNSTRSAYKAGMSMRYIDDYNLEFQLEGKGFAKLGLMIERGVSPFDIKEGFERSPKAKRNEDGGWYLTIPFRHATSSAIAESGAFANRMPKPVEKIAKKSSSPLRLPDLPPEFQNKGKRAELVGSDNLVIKEYKHKSAIFEGLTHGKKEHHGQYTTFRRVSDNSDPLSWIHMGFEEHNFMGKALNSLTNEFEPIIDLAEEQFLADRFK